MRKQFKVVVLIRKDLSKKQVSVKIKVTTGTRESEYFLINTLKFDPKKEFKI